MKTKQKRSNKGTYKVPKQELTCGLYLENEATPEIESKHINISKINLQSNKFENIHNLYHKTKNID